MSDATDSGHDREESRRGSTRRIFLRGAGVTMALPWLESVPVWGASPASGGAPAAAPKRFAALFMGCGVNPDQWWARGSGATMELGRCLEPLAPLRSKINVVNGVFNKHATGVGIHPGQTPFLRAWTSARCSASCRWSSSIRASAAVPSTASTTLSASR